MTKAEIIQSLNAQYRQTQKENEQDRDSRVARVREMDVEIARLQDENARMFATSSKKLLTDWKNAREISETLKKNVLINQNKIKARLAALGFAPDELEMRYHCVQCKDTGYLENGAQCPCFQQKILLALHDTSLQECFASFDEDIYPDTAQKNQALNARNICEAYADSFPRTQTENLLLMGESGLGKTFLLNCLAERVLSRGLPCVRLTAFRMQEAMRKYHFGQDDAPFESMLNADLLCIDDLGTEPMLKNVTVEYLFLLLNERAASGRHTVIATNLAITELQQRYGERVMSRLMNRRNTTFLRLTGSDLRLKKEKRG